MAEVPRFARVFAYFIKDATYVRYDMESDRALNDPPPTRPLTELISGLPGTGGDCDFSTGRIRGAITLGDKIYLFKGSKCVKADIALARVESCQAIEAVWPGMTAAGFGGDIDAALNTGTGTVFFFKGANFVSFDVTKNKVSGVAHPIAGGWPAFGRKGFGGTFNAALNANNGLGYVFKDAAYIRVNIKQKTTLPAYPLDTAKYWHGLPAAFAGGADSVLGFTDPTSNLTLDLSDDFFKGTKTLATRLGCQPIDLLKVWNVESTGVHAWAHNPKGAAGINQMIPDNLVTHGYTKGVDAYLKLTAADQLAGPVTKYYEFYKNQGRDLSTGERLYLANYLPAKLGVTDPNEALSRKGESAYDQNPLLDFNHDDKVTLTDLKQVLEAHAKGERWDAIAKRLAATP